MAVALCCSGPYKSPYIKALHRIAFEASKFVLSPLLYANPHAATRAGSTSEVSIFFLSETDPSLPSSERSITKGGKIGESLGDWAIWAIVTAAAGEIGIERFGAHDLRRTCAKLCRKAGGDLEQIKFLLGHSSIQTTERYLGSEQDIAIAVNDSLVCEHTRILSVDWFART